MKKSIYIIVLFSLFLASCQAGTSTGVSQTNVPTNSQNAPEATKPILADTQPAPTATKPSPTATTVPTATAKPAEAGVSRSNPLPLGSEFKGTDWSIVVTDVIRGTEAAQAIAKANQFNEPAKQDYEYLIANVQLTNISEKQEAQDTTFAVDLKVTGDKNIVYSRASVVPPKPFEGKLFPQGKAEGQIVFEVPGDEKNLMFLVGEGMSFDLDATRFVAIDKDAKIVPDPSLRDIKPSDTGSSRDHSAKINDPLVAGSWEFSITEAIIGDKAAELAKKANQFNDPPAEGKEYVAIKLKARYLGSDEPDHSENISGPYLTITGENNVVYESPIVVPPEPALDATLFAGGETEGWVILSVGEDEKGLTVIFQPLFSFSKDTTRYISIGQ